MLPQTKYNTQDLEVDDYGSSKVLSLNPCNLNTKFVNLFSKYAIIFKVSDQEEIQCRLKADGLP